MDVVPPDPPVRGSPVVNLDVLVRSSDAYPAVKDVVPAEDKEVFHHRKTVDSGPPLLYRRAWPAGFIGREACDLPRIGPEAHADAIHPARCPALAVHVSQSEV